MHRVKVGLLCAGLLLAAGCTGSGGDQAATLPPKTTHTPAPTTTAPPATTTAPPATPTPDAASAIAIAVKANTALNVLYARQDPTPLRAISDGCGRCEEYINAILSKKRAGYSFSGEQTSIIDKPRFAGYNVTSHAGGVVMTVSASALHVTDPHGRPYVNPTDPAGGDHGFARVRFTCILVWFNEWGLKSFDYEVL